MGRQWKMLPIGKNDKGQPEIHYTRIYRTFVSPLAGRWLHGCHLCGLGKQAS